MRLILFILCAAVVLLAACGGSDDPFEQVGYYKGDNNLRYFTYYVEGYESVDRDNLPAELVSLIREHGRSRVNTDGQVTASFYYLKPGAAPNITLMSAQQANDAAHNRKPVMSVWILPTGRVNVFKNPE